MTDEFHGPSIAEPFEGVDREPVVKLADIDISAVAENQARMIVAIHEVRSALGLTGTGGKYRSVFRSHDMWRFLAAHAGQLRPGVVKRAAAWGEKL